MSGLQHEPLVFGERRLAGGWRTWFILPVVLGLGASLGWGIGIAAWLLGALPFLLEPRLAHTVLGQLGWEASVWGGMAGIVVALWVVLTGWFSAMPMRVEVAGAEIRWQGAFWRGRVAARDVVRAFVSQQPGEGAALHLWTRWRDVVIPARRVAGGWSPSVFGELSDAVAQALALEGKHLELGVPPSAVTREDRPWFFWLFWGHRRWLVRQAERHDGPAGVVDHREPLPSMRSAWLLRPAPWALWMGVVGVVVSVGVWTSSAQAPVWLAGVGLLSCLLLPLWNALKSATHRLWHGSGLTPESLIGHDRLDTLPPRLVPAPGCCIDLEGQQVSRPDGWARPFAQLRRVEYGPASGLHPRDALQRAIASTAWQLAVVEQEADVRQPVQIYSNASVDTVRYGDLDAGYALFNWVAARELALGTGAELVLASGRVGGPHGGGTLLVERLERDLTHYDPGWIERELEGAGERCRVHVRESAERFEAWGPLTRQPELCASPPIFKMLGLIFCIVLIGLGYSPAGLLGGYLLARIVADVMTVAHFKHTGFAMDRKGIWVRGECIGWEELEATTLMPIAPGPVMFCAPRRVLVVGHLGGSYRERAYLGCAAYAWIRRHVKADAVAGEIR